MCMAAATIVWRVFLKAAAPDRFKLNDYEPKSTDSLVRCQPASRLSAARDRCCRHRTLPRNLRSGQRTGSKSAVLKLRCVRDLHLLPLHRFPRKTHPAVLPRGGIVGTVGPGAS